MKQKFGCAGRRRRQMTHYLNLVPISAEIYRKLCRMTRICITLAVLLVAVMFGLADMYLQGITRKEMQSTGNWHYQFTGLDAQTAAFISSRPETAVSGWHSTVPGNAGYSVAGMGIAVSAPLSSWSGAGCSVDSGGIRGSYCIYGYFCYEYIPCSIFAVLQHTGYHGGYKNAISYI